MKKKTWISWCSECRFNFINPYTGILLKYSSSPIQHSCLKLCVAMVNKSRLHDCHQHMFCFCFKWQIQPPNPVCHLWGNKKNKQLSHTAEAYRKSNCIIPWRKKKFLLLLLITLPLFLLVSFPFSSSSSLFLFSILPHLLPTSHFYLPLLPPLLPISK